jgi:hypothetical protein
MRDNPSPRNAAIATAVADPVVCRNERRVSMVNSSKELLNADC